MYRPNFTLTAFATAVLFCAPAPASVLFDFEDQAETGFSDGALTSLELSSGGLTIEITRPGDPNQFDIYDVNDIGNPTLPSTWGVRSISPWFSNAGTAFVVNFSQPVEFVSIEMADFGQDPDDLFLEGFAGLDATGNLLDQAADQLPGGTDFTGATLSIETATPSIQSIRFMGGTESYETPFGTFSIPNSVYYDNLAVVVPEPASLALLAGAGALAFRRRN
jgi:hypothetical protein